MKPEDIPVLTGYYRYTDILFEYHKAIDDPSDVSAFKAFVSKDALGDENHPFWTDKNKGLQLYIGTLPSGQLRLMFSSAQVEYARYWLKAMGLTKKLLPLPSSDYLLTDSILRNVSKTHLKSSDEVRKSIRMIEKNNNKLKGTDSTLISYRQMFEKVRNLYTAKKGTWLAIDIEAWEMDHNVITECGWSYTRWDGDAEVTDKSHFIVKENLLYTNGKYVTNARENYRFGESKVLNKAEFKNKIKNMVSGFQASGPLFLVFHDCSQDLKYLKGSYFDLPLDSLTFILPSDIPENGTFSIDTTELFGALEGDVGEKRKLEMMLKLLKIDAEHLHNAGNDAHYTMLALQSMATGNQIDAQREQRWPNQTEASPETGTTFKVVHNQWEYDSDYSDTEGAFGKVDKLDDIEAQLDDLGCFNKEDE